MMTAPKMCERRLAVERDLKHANFVRGVLMAIVSLLFCLISTPLVRPQIQSKPKPKTTCNQDGTLCVKADVEQSVVVNPLYFEVRVRCSEQITLGWELRDDSGKLI
jgi:hypothetical protein